MQPELQTSRRRHLWLWMLLPLIVSAATHGLWAPDEPRYAEVAREVFAEPGWLVMRLCGEVYPDKPPLLFWLAGLFGWLSGWSPFAMRLVSILSMVGTALLIRRLAGRHFGAREAELAPAIFLGTAMVTELGGRLQIDPLLCLLTTLAIERLDPQHPTTGARRRLRVAGLAMGLGMLAKGPVAVLIPMLVWAAWRWLSGRARRPLVIDPLAIALTLLPVGLWAGAVIALQPELAGPLLFDQHAGRLTTDKGGNHWGPPWDHLVTLPLLVAPWTLVFLAALVAGAQAWSQRRSHAAPRDPGIVLAFLWLAVLFLFFSAIPPKRNLYLLPAYPAIALLVAALWARWEAASRTSWLTYTPGALLLVLGLVLTAAGLAAPALAASDPKLAANLATIPALAPGLPWRLPLGAAPLLVGGLLALRALRRRHLAAAGHAVLLGWAVGASTLFALLFPGFDAVKSAQDLAHHVDALHADAVGDEAALVPCFGIKPEGLRFYAPLATVTGVAFERLFPSALPPALAAGELKPGPELDAALLRAWRAQLGAQTFVILAERVWLRLPNSVRSEFRVLAEDRLGSKALVVVVPTR